jgi:hypothetical protein
MKRPADDAPMELWCVQGGVKVHSFQVRKDDVGEWALGPMEHVYFDGRSCETSHWLVAIGNAAHLSPKRLAERGLFVAQRALAALREAAGMLERAVQPGREN